MNTEIITQTENEEVKLKTVTLRQAKEFLALRKQASSLIALGVFLCILSPSPLFILNGLIDAKKLPDYTIFFGLAMLLIIVAIAVALFMLCSFRCSDYAFLSSEMFNAEVGVTGFASNEKSKFGKKYMIFNIVGVVLCLLSPLPFLFVMTATESLALLTALVSVLALIAAGVALFVFAGVQHTSYQKLLKQGDFSDEAKQIKKKKDIVLNIFWIAVTAIYLLWSFIGNAWTVSWLVWPIAGVMSAIISAVCNLVFLPKKK